MNKAIRAVSVAEAKSNLSQQLSPVKEGSDIRVTRPGKPVAIITRPPVAEGDAPKLGTLAGKVQFMPGWDEPISEQELLGE